MPSIDFSLIRRGLEELPRADHHNPGQRVDIKSLYVVHGHRSALDLERTLIVGNRGMGKSFWTHALTQSEIRDAVAEGLHQPLLRSTEVLIGFNAADQGGEIAPSPYVIQQALESGTKPENIWRAVMARAASKILNQELEGGFVDQMKWVDSNAEGFGHLLKEADSELVGSNRKLLVVFDALDRLADDWNTTRRLTQALLQRALAASSYRAIRLKVFMRLDQFSDKQLFEFPDSSKIRNTRVDLEWTSTDLYGLLFQHLLRSSASREAFKQLAGNLAPVSLTKPIYLDSAQTQKGIVDAMAGEFMTAGDRKDPSKRGRVFTWLPEHLADARGQVSPRTFLTAWREAAHHGPQPEGKAVDHLGLQQGVRKASEDRLSELKEDYPWIEPALEPLRGHQVPMERSVLESLWMKEETAKLVIRQSKSQGQLPRLPPVQLEDQTVRAEQALIQALEAIGVMEIRTNGKINLPDIFRVEAGIKRKGGVRPPILRGSQSGR